MTNYKEKYPKAFNRFIFSIEKRPSIEKYINQYIEKFIETKRDDEYFAHFMKNDEDPFVGCKTVEEEEEMLKYCLEHNQTVDEVRDERLEELHKEEEELGYTFMW